MKQDELEEKVNMAEELILGLVKRMEVIESELPEFLKSFLEQYKETLSNISGQIEKSNRRYDDQKISQQIDQVKGLVGTMPKVITVKNEHHHHFGAWSKNLITGVVVCFLITASSVGTALYLKHENNRMRPMPSSFVRLGRSPLNGDIGRIRPTAVIPRRWKRTPSSWKPKRWKKPMRKKLPEKRQKRLRKPGSDWTL